MHRVIVNEDYLSHWHCVKHAKSRGSGICLLNSEMH